MAVVREGMFLFSVCSKGYGKRTDITQYPRHNRGGQGVVDIRTGARNGHVVAAQAVGEDDEVVLVTVGGQIIRGAVRDVSAIGRGTMGVRVIRLRKGDEVAAAERIPADALEEEKSVTEEKGPSEEKGA